MSSTLSSFNWRENRQPSIFLEDNRFNGRNLGLSQRATALLEPIPSRDSIYTETGTKQKPAVGAFATV